MFSSTTITPHNKSYPVRLCLKTKRIRHKGKRREIRKFFMSDRIKAVGMVSGLPGYNRTVSLGRPSTGMTADAVTTRKPSKALPGVAPPVRPTLSHRKKV